MHILNLIKKIKKIYLDSNKRNVLQLALTTKCNLICKHCLRTEYAGETLSFEKFKFYLDKFSSSNFNTLLLGDFGEIFLIPDILDYLKYAKQKKWQIVETVTNGTLLNKNISDVILAESLLNNLIVSIEAVNKEKYFNIRGTNIEFLIKNLEYFNALKLKYKTKVTMILSVCCFKENLNELPLIVDFAAKYNFDKIYFVHINSNNFLKQDKQTINKFCVSNQHLNNIEKNKVIDIFSQVLEKAKNNKIHVFLPENYFDSEIVGNEEYTKQKYIENSYEKYFCNFPFKWTVVGIDGNIYPCCQMAKKFPIGNLNELSGNYDVFLASSSFKNFISHLKKKEEPLNVCKNCNIYKGAAF